MSGTTGFGAPSFQTGDNAWNSALGTLSRGLFPDPTAAAHAYYYGSEARKAQIEGYKNIGEINAGNRTFGFLPGSGVPQSPITFQQPPIPGMGPIMAPAQNLPMQGAQGQPPPLSSAVVPPGGGQGGQPPPLGPVSLDRLSNAVAPGNQPNNKGIGATGTPPPASPPAPGTPPAPNTTTSNGQVPTDDQGSGPINMHTVTDADGGRKYSGPAASNGSPAVPQFDLGTYAALQAAAGRNPEMAKLQILSYILDAEQRGNLPVGTAKTIEQRQSQADQLSAAFGSPVFESKQATARTGMTVAGGIAQENIRQSGETARTKLGVQVARDAQGNPVFTNTGAVAAAPGTIPAFNTEVYKTGEEVHTTGGAGPYGTGGTLTKGKDLRSGAPAYSAEIDKAMNTSVRVYRTGPDGKPDVSQPTYAVKYGDALRDKLPITPESSDQVSAILRGASLTTDVSQPGRRLSDVIAQTTPLTPPASTSVEGGKALTLQDDYIANTYQAPDLTGIKGARTERAQLLDGPSNALTDRRDELMRTNPRLTPENALQTARSQLENEGYLPSAADSAKARANGLRLWGNENINRQVKNGQVQGKFMIPLLKDYTSKLTGTVIHATPGTTTQQPLDKPIGPAPPDAVEGQSFTKNGRIAVVRNGQLYEVTQ